MADNFATPVPDATTLATKDIAGIHHPKNLIAKWDGSDADLATQTTLAAINTKLAASVAVTQSGAWGVTVSASLPSGSNVVGGVTQSGTWNVGVTGSVAVTGTFWQATQPVSITGSQAVNLTQVGGAGLATNAGNASSGTQRVVIATDQPAPLNPWRGCNIVQPADASFTRPADTTAYATGDLIANSTTAGSVTHMSFSGASLTAGGGSGRITDLILIKNGTAAARVRAHFLKSAHAVTSGDNGALVFTSLDPDNYIGFMDVAFTGTDDGVGSGGNLIAKSYDPSVSYALSGSDTVHLVLEALTPFTPASAGLFGARPTFEVLT